MTWKSQVAAFPADGSIPQLDYPVNIASADGRCRCPTRNRWSGLPDDQDRHRFQRDSGQGFRRLAFRCRPMGWLSRSQPAFLIDIIVWMKSLRY